MTTVKKLFNETSASMMANSLWIEMTLRHNIPVSECSDHHIAQLTNLLLIVVAEFHLTRSIRSCGLIIPPEIEGQLRELRNYLPHNDAGYPSTDICKKDIGDLMRLACWLHHLNMSFTYSRGTAQSRRREDHEEVGSLLYYLVGPGVGFLTSMMVIDRVLWENETDTQRELEDAKENLNETELKLKPIKEEVKVAKKELKKISKSQVSCQSDIQHAYRKHKHLCQEQKDKEEFLKECKYQMVYCQHYLAWWPPGEAPRSQNPRVPFRGQGYYKSFTPRYNNPRHQNTTVANQAYTINATTPNANVSYA